MVEVKYIYISHYYIELKYPITQINLIYIAIKYLHFAPRRWHWNGLVIFNKIMN